MEGSLTIHSISIVVIIFLSSLSFPTQVQATEPEMVISQGIQLISEQRTKAETQVSILKGLLVDQDITQKEYVTAKTKYSEAQGAFNGWIDRLLYDLRKEQELESSKGYQDTLKEAAEKGDVFVQYVQKLFLGEQPRGEGTGPFVSLFLKPITDAGIAIWHEVRDYLNIKHHQKENVLADVKAQLLPLKWRDFEEVLADLGHK